MPRLRKRRFVKILFLLVFLFSCFLGVMFYAPQGFGKEQAFAVNKGEGVHQISKKLKAVGLIRSRFFFETYVWLKGAGSRMNEGSFSLSNHLSVAKLVSTLSESPGDTMKITIPEGFTVNEIFDRLEKNRVSSAKTLMSLGPNDFTGYVFLKSLGSLEGFLFPETHFFSENADPKVTLKIYLDEFQKQALPELLKGKDRTLYEYLVMASIIEAEVPHEQDRAVISGILWKRLDAGMPLQVDSTLNYVTGGRNASLTSEELKKDSPYNTYLYPDLPPTPIGNPGLSAIHAAVDPKDSVYWFFLSGKDGKTYFARDFEEHKRNKEKYLR